MKLRSPQVGAAWLALLLVAPTPVAASSGAPARPLEDYAGSFQLENGEVITGGLFIERAGGDERFLYLDTTGLVKVGIFERQGELQMRSLLPSEQFGIEFVPGPDGALDTIVWTGPEGSLRGRRVYPHHASPITIPAQGAELDGRLLVPECAGPHPLVVLVGGSGPTTRWGGVFDTWFVTLGMTVLGYDKRGVGEDDWFEPDLTTLAADAAAAVRAGTGFADIDPERIGLWASSQGGWVAPIAATEVDLDFLVVRVGPGVSELEAHVHETRQEARQEGLAGLALDHASGLLREIYGLAVAGEPLSATDALVTPYLDQSWYRTAFGAGLVSSRWSERWWRWAQANMAVEPGPSLRQLDLPILWFLAENDENVPLIASRAALERAFNASPGDDQTLVVIEGANHAFLVTGPDGNPRYASGYFGRIKRWLAERGLSNESCWSTQTAPARPAEERN